jgi:hypothetical protein
LAAVVEPARLTPEELLEFMEELRGKDPDGCLKPTDVLEAARPKDSPIHDRFTWSNSAAAHQYRLIEAGQLIASVEMEIRLRGSSVSAVRVKTYHYLPADRRVGRGYRHRDDIQKSRDHLADLRNELRSDLANLAKRCKNLLPQESAQIEALLAKL